LDPSNPDVVYAGTAFSNDFFCNDGEGILKSTDGGATWAQLPGPLPSGPGLVAEVWSLGVSPTDGNVLLAVASSGSGNGLYRSPDGGSTWEQVIASESTGNGYQVLFDPTNGNVAYASLDTVYKSVDGGSTWTTANGTGSNVLPAGYIWLAIAPSSPSTLYAGTGSQPAFGTYMFRTTDGGQNWTPLTDPDWSSMVLVDPVNPNIILSAGYGLYESMDGGSSWNWGDSGFYGFRGGMEFSADGGVLYMGTEGGVWAATNVAASPWTLTDLNAALATSDFLNVVIHPTNPSIAFAASDSNGVALYSGQLEW